MGVLIHCYRDEIPILLIDKFLSYYPILFIMATPATITQISRVKQSAKNGKFYIFGVATIPGQETVLGSSTEDTALVNIEMNSLADSVKEMLTQDADDPSLFLGSEETKGLDIKVTFREMRDDVSDDGTLRYWCKLA